MYPSVLERPGQPISRMITLQDLFTLYTCWIPSPHETHDVCRQDDTITLELTFVNPFFTMLGSVQVLRHRGVQLQLLTLMMLLIMM